jgi:hypothetical protein
MQSHRGNDASRVHCNAKNMLVPGLPIQYRAFSTARRLAGDCTGQGRRLGQEPTCRFPHVVHPLPVFSEVAAVAPYPVWRHSATYSWTLPTKLTAPLTTGGSRRRISPHQACQSQSHRQRGVGRLTHDMPDQTRNGPGVVGDAAAQALIEQRCSDVGSSNSSRGCNGGAN